MGFRNTNTVAALITKDLVGFMDSPINPYRQFVNKHADAINQFAANEIPLLKTFIRYRISGVMPLVSTQKKFNDSMAQFLKLSSEKLTIIKTQILELEDNEAFKENFGRVLQGELTYAQFKAIVLGIKTPDVTQTVQTTQAANAPAQTVQATTPFAKVETVAEITAINLPGGISNMGDEDFEDNPVHAVTLSPFLLQQTPLTQKQFLELTGENPSHFQGTEYPDWEDRPAENMTWDQAVLAGKALTLKEDNVSAEIKDQIRDMDAHTYQIFALKNRNIPLWRLPTETEGEYASRAGKNNKYGVDGDEWEELKEDVIGDHNSGGQTASVKRAGVKENAWGFIDLSGNVYEWRSDWYDENFYQEGENYTDPIGPESGRYRVLRGGSWIYKDDENFRSGYRCSLAPAGHFKNYGFRLARNAG